MSELPSGTVTFLFTDIEGSTRLWEEFPDAMRPALARHDQILRDAVAEHNGHVVKTTGDGMHAVFATARDALDAAAVVQAALAAEPFGETGPLHVRMGVHTCEAECRDGDYYGSEVNRAARLMSVAHGGQIVVSAVTSGLVRDADVELFDLGEHRLRDLTVAERVFQVGASTFPPLRSLDAFPGNLPRQLTSFVGRHEELAGVAKALDEWRLVTLTGTGGVGKTRLATQVAAEVLPRFRDGAWLCELAVAADGERMAQVIAGALGASQRPGMSLEASIDDFLRTKELLLVLDNCEQLLGPVSRLAEELLRGCPRVRILATSREGLAVGGEHVWPLRSLPLPDASGADITTNDAVRLFAERAAGARATFTLDAASVDAVGEICRRLDGIPLAIELAAARVVSMSPVEISGLLDERFRLLTGGRRSAVERHQTLRATVDWSYLLLTEAERTVFDRLGVFVGSFDATAAQAIVVGDGVGQWDVLDALAELVAKSMVVAEATVDGTTRYQMLETLRQYARERLDERGDGDGWRRRHAEYFAVWAEECGPALVGPDEFVWRTREAAELDNLRAAVSWGLDRDDAGDVGLALRVVGALADEAQSNPPAGVGAWAEEALPHLESATPELRYAVTAAAAQRRFLLGDDDAAQDLALAALGDGLPLGAPAPVLAHTALATSIQLDGDGSGALTLMLDAARVLERDLPGSVYAAQAHALACFYASQWGDPVARAEGEIAVREARGAANPSTLALALSAYGQGFAVDDPEAALEALDESIALCRQGASPGVFSYSLQGAARLRVQLGDVPGAAHDAREGIEQSHRIGSRATVYNSVGSGIEILTAYDRFTDAAVFDGVVSSHLSADFRASARFAAEHAAITHARTAIGADQYDAAFQTGASMTYDQAVEHTLRVLEDVIRELDDV